MTKRFTERQMLEHSSRAIGKIAHRMNGVHLVSTEEIEAMAVLLLILGVPALKPDEKINNHIAFYKPITDRFGVPK